MVGRLLRRLNGRLSSLSSLLAWNAYKKGAFWPLFSWKSDGFACAVLFVRVVRNFLC
jgi:hypothetical protein